MWFLHYQVATVEPLREPCRGLVEDKVPYGTQPYASVATENEVSVVFAELAILVNMTEEIPLQQLVPPGMIGERSHHPRELGTYYPSGAKDPTYVVRSYVTKALVTHLLALYPEPLPGV